MIRINLANSSGASSKKKTGRAVKEKKSSSVRPVFLVLLLILAVGVGAYYVMEYLKDMERQQPVKASLPPPVPKAEATPATKPSSLVKTNMAENVVKEIEGDSRIATTPTSTSASRLNATYLEMSDPEKINYEVLFGRNVFDMIARCSRPGIGFGSLELENFQAIYASGSGMSRQMVQDMFTAYKNEKGELMPKPLSYIKDDDNSKGNFRFVITFQPRYGNSVDDPFQAIDHIGFKGSIPQLLRTFSRLAGENNYKITAQPRQISTERAGSYRRITHKVSGTSTFGDFHKFVVALHNEKVPCAFKKISMKPIKDEIVRIDAEILFTVRE
jgi:hypothetical protein